MYFAPDSTSFVDSSYSPSISLESSFSSPVTNFEYMKLFSTLEWLFKTQETQEEHLYKTMEKQKTMQEKEQEKTIEEGCNKNIPLEGPKNFKVLKESVQMLDELQIKGVYAAPLATNYLTNNMESHQVLRHQSTNTTTTRSV